MSKWTPLSILPLAMLAANIQAKAVEAVNGNVSAGYEYTTMSNSDAYNDYDNTQHEFLFSGQITAPLGEYFGVEGGLGFLNATSQFKNKAFNNTERHADMDANRSALFAGIFYRDPNFIKLGITQGYLTSDLDVSNSNDYKATAESTSLITQVYSDFYLNKVDLGIAFNYADIDSDVNLNGINSSSGDNGKDLDLNARLYFTDNIALKFNTALRVLDSDTTNFTLALQWQPVVTLPLVTTFEYSYDKEVDSSYLNDTYHGFGIGVNYFFNSNVSMKERNRKYL